MPCSGAGCYKSRKGGLAHAATGGSLKPVRKADEIERHRDQDVLERRFRLGCTFVIINEAASALTVPKPTSIIHCWEG